MYTTDLEKGVAEMIGALFVEHSSNVEDILEELECNPRENDGDSFIVDDVRIANEEEDYGVVYINIGGTELKVTVKS